jgi:uncharacterized protein YaaN involved in tellurite resistance
MCLFNSKKKLIAKVNMLEEALDSARAGRSDAIKDLNQAKTEITALRNVIDRQNELLAKNKKRIKTQQEIINKQNEQLGIKPKRVRKVEDKDTDPYVEE